MERNYGYYSQYFSPEKKPVMKEFNTKPKINKENTKSKKQFNEPSCDITVRYQS